MQKNNLTVFPIPDGIALNDDFTVRVRCVGGEWKNIPAYNVKVDMHNVRDASMVHFDFSGTVELEIVKNSDAVESVAIRPLSYGIDFRQEGNKIILKLDRPRKFSLEVNGDRFHNLHVFACAPEENVPLPDAPEVLFLKPGTYHSQEILRYITTVNPVTGKTPDIIYFAPGMHFIEDYIAYIPSGKTVYIAGGAAVVGSIHCYNVQDVTIRGRGVIYLTEIERNRYLGGLRLSYSKNIRIEGIMVINPSVFSIVVGETSQVYIKDFKSFSCTGWSDGIDFICGSDSVVEDVFLRNSDDCITVYGNLQKFSGGSRNITVRNAILWADVAHPILIGTHGDAKKDGDILEDLCFEDIDILNHHEPQENYQGCMSINVGDRNTARNIRFENIRVEQFELGRLLDVRVFFNPDYNPAPGKKIENIYFKNITYTGRGELPSRIMGYDGERIVDGITIENLVINGKHILNAEDGNMEIGEFTKDIKFI